MTRLQPRAHSMSRMRSAGFACGMTEYYNAHTGKRHDLYGFIDFIATGNKQIVGVQCCNRNDLGNHRHKIATDCRQDVEAWLDCGGAIEIHAWDRKDKKYTPNKPKIKPTWEGRVLRLWVEHVTHRWLQDYDKTDRQRRTRPALTEVDNAPF